MALPPALEEESAEEAQIPARNQQRSAGGQQSNLLLLCGIKAKQLPFVQMQK